MIIKKEAKISECNQYRYMLSRVWDISKPKVMFMMLNPSIADENKDDPTIRRCIGFAQKWECGGLYVCNLFAFRETNPKKLLKLQNIVGEENNYFIKKYADEVDIIICAWGNKLIIKSIFKKEFSFELLDFVKDKLYYLKLTKDGTTPRHPLYLKSDLKPIKYNL